MKGPFKYLLHTKSMLEEIAKSLARNHDTKAAALVRKKLYRTPCAIDTGVYIKNRSNFFAGYGSALYHATYILNSNGTFSIGNNSHLGAFCYVNVCFGSVDIGNDVAIGPGTKIIAYSNHYLKGKKVTEERIVGNITIGDNVFVGANCTILPDATINDNVVIAAGSIVKGTLESNSIYGGAPCKLIRKGWYNE